MHTGLVHVAVEEVGLSDLGFSEPIAWHIGAEGIKMHVVAWVLPRYGQGLIQARGKHL